MSTSKLFQPITVGRLSLSHRVVLAPMTRLRVNPVTLSPLLPLVKDYYVQRAKVPGTLLISEGTVVAPKASGFPGAPEIWTEEQISAWKEIVDGVHAQGSYIYLQIAAMGRQASPDFLKSRDSTFPHVGPSALHHAPGAPIPREMTKEEINESIEFFGISAANAVHKAGFDGVEIHGANGFLVDQFLQSTSNVRDDEYGGSVQKRVKFPLEVIERVVKEVGADRVGLRLSPWNRSAGMRMEDPIPTFSYLTTRVKELYPDFAFIHVVEARVDGFTDLSPEDIKEFETNDFIRKIWAPKPLISAGGYTRESGMETAEEKGDLIAYGRWYISNPDLLTRLEKNIPLSKYDRPTFYVSGDTSGVGFTDYPFAQ
ncbi:related to NADH:flavin oxidoreductase/12-oxophytodienoate reductase [Armillaria ostoyae]|uniref:Related to NADH:flavin oxidoreductase/12-oxophytodienoate reductase n=1 Tax=Armillaria ostoyae TaxID=47428 RepID=A0A284RPW2_ARMOS|nr:related to NADH:flavin oxidoreductase/12-oxophytodienoate reductase [Armillaria ostoyae]